MQGLRSMERRRRMCLYFKPLQSEHNAAYGLFTAALINNDLNLYKYEKLTRTILSMIAFLFAIMTYIQKRVQFHSFFPVYVIPYMIIR